ncbi:MAG: ATP-dependent DNA ligase [Candidatus Bathyarchaeota archaeon]|nr:ATP-dependent DNA ligase [Candidatus Bathyarchaeota archaeon]
MEYSIVTDAYEKIEATTKRLEMTDYLVDLIKKTPKNFIDKIAFLTQGKLCPDFLGIEIGMAEKMVISSIAKAAELEKSEIAQKFRKTGDLGLTAEQLLEKMPAPRKPLTAEEVYDTLNKIAHTSGKGSVEEKVNLLAGLLRKATPKEARYIVRTVTGRLRLGVGDMTFLDALAVAYFGDKKRRNEIERAYNLSSDLGLVAKTLMNEGADGIKKIKITIGRPVRAMLAERLKSPKEILEKIGGIGSVEYKYDGLRIQAHMSPDRTRLFSRRLENLTDQFPDIREALKNSLNVKEAVVEGECVAVDPNTGEMRAFQVISQRRGRKYKIEEMIEEIPTTIFLFDILYKDGENLIDWPYPKRRKELERIVKETRHVKLAEQFITDDPDQLEQYMDKAIEGGSEGLMVKALGEDSVYQAGSRGFLWIKYKKEYKSEMADTVDLVAVGAFAGRGRRAGTYGALLMAAYDPKADEFKTVCKLGTGFDDATLSQFPRVFEPYRVSRQHPRVDSQIKADYWFVPNVVLEVLGAELTLSPSHTCGLDAIKKDSGIAIRFPRFTGRWRKDKAPENATTTNEIIKMYRSQLKKM